MLDPLCLLQNGWLPLRQPSGQSVHTLLELLTAKYNLLKESAVTQAPSLAYTLTKYWLKKKKIKTVYKTVRVSTECILKKRKL